MRRKSIEHRKLRKLPLFVAVVGCLYGATALAHGQEQESAEEETTQQQEQAEGRTTELDRITVTGSLLRRVEYDSISPVQVITADTSVAVGMVDTAEFLHKSSVVAGSTQISHQFAGFVVEGGSGVQTVSLRGLGAGRTAVLLNGNRPGPAGTRGQVLGFDLNVIPQSIVQRIEILKDGSSSIYGSDAVAGAVNIITRRNFDGAEFSINGRMPFIGGGENYSVSFANGWNFDNGNIALAAEYYRHEPLRFGDRDYLRCSEDLIYDAAGNRIDREDRSVLGGTRWGGCNNLLLTAVDDAGTGVRYVPSPDGSTDSMIPGYIPSVVTNLLHPTGAGHNQVLNSPLWDRTQVIDRQERINLYGLASFSFGNVNWDTEVLANRRTTETARLRQFFPLIGGTTAFLPSYQYTDGSDFAAPVPSGIARPIMPFPSLQEVEVDYFYVNTGLDGFISGTDSWSWSADASFSRSDGDYSSFAIINELTGDADPALRATTGGRSPSFDYFQPCALNGECIDDLAAAIGRWHTGNTVYDQFVFKGVVTGELFQMPAGAAAAAFGVEYRDFSIDDQPSELERTGQLWGSSSAVVTKGSDSVKEVFTEIELPLLSGVTGFESLDLNLSGRWFDYDSVDGSDYVWKAGLGWQIVPSFRVRATRGTSYRAPGLYEMFLGNLSGFAGQTSIDPCIRWGESTNTNLIANCAAAGIPDDYAATGGSASSAETFTGGAGTNLNPETSTAFTAGVVWTPEFAPISVAVDYFEYEVQDQITRLGPATILAGCYGATVYPNNFCDLFVRNSPDHGTAPNKIEEVYSTYVNIDMQKVRGYDLLVRYDGDLAFGKLEIEGQATYMMEDYSRLFSPGTEDGFLTNDRNGDISRPKIVGNLRVGLNRNDWTYTWGMDYVGSTRSLDLNPNIVYQLPAGSAPNAFRDISAESRLYHHLSARYKQPKWDVMVGVRNVLDAAPPSISTGGDSRYGNMPAFATQYDLYGRSLFVRYNRKF